MEVSQKLESAITNWDFVKLIESDIPRYLKPAFTNLLKARDHFASQVLGTLGLVMLNTNCKCIYSRTLILNQIIKTGFVVFLADLDSTVLEEEITRLKKIHEISKIRFFNLYETNFTYAIKMMEDVHSSFL